MERKKILIVDDDKDFAGNISKVLNSNGYLVYESHSAADGLADIIKIKPDLLVLDVMMETDTAGFEFVFKIRSRGRVSKYREVKDTPVIMLTGINQATNSRFSLDDRENFLPGINAFLTKPVDIDELLEKVVEIFHEVTVK